MKINKITLILLLLCLMSGAGNAATYKVMTWNIRYENTYDSVNNWSNRKDNLCGTITRMNPDILGLQEVLKSQLDYVQGKLSNYGYFGVGRDDGKEAGEYAPIFYNKLRFTYLDGGYFWLGENPSVPVKGWDAACVRICTWVRLQDNDDKSVIFVFNTHLDHEGVNARTQGALLIKDKIRAISGRDAVLLMGDFNCTDESQAFEELTAGKFLQDSRKTSIVPQQGPGFTWSGFEVKGKHGGVIDHILYRKFGKVLRYVILDDNKDGRYFSDHLPVFIEIAPD
jgi:endonuclease/exonuclease/phosphatase family metal-dependent hydrolase